MPNRIQLDIDLKPQEFESIKETSLAKKFTIREISQIPYMEKRGHGFGLNCCR